MLAGLVVGVLVAGLAPWSQDASADAAADRASIRTQVAGISIERSSVDDEAESTVVSTVVSTIPAPTTTAAPTITAAPVTAPPTTAVPTTVPATVPAPAPAEPATTVEALRAQVLSQIAFPWEDVLPGWRIEFLPSRPGYRGSTFPDRQLIQIYQRSNLTVADYVHVTAHELGHAIDVTLLDDADHERWNETRGRAADAAWWVASGADDFSSGAGDWAECFAWSQLPSGRFYSRVGGPPTGDQLAVMADIVAAALR